MTVVPDARAAGRIALPGGLTVNRLGYGAMRVTGEGIWGEPRDRAEALRVLRRVPELGVDFIDTADSYGPFVSEELIAEALHPYDGLVIATKGGQVRHGPNQWLPVGRPEYLRQCVLMSLRRLRVERIDLWQLHRIDPKVPADEQFDAIAAMQKEGLLKHAGLSKAGIDEIRWAQRFFTVATVQNRYNLAQRDTEDERIVEHCAREGIGFIPYYPLAAGALAKPGALLDRIAAQHGASAGQVALAWLLRRSPIMMPIPGTSRVAHLAENIAAASLVLSDDEFEAIARAVPAPPAMG